MASGNHIPPHGPFDHCWFKYLKKITRAYGCENYDNVEIRQTIMILFLLFRHISDPPASPTTLIQRVTIAMDGPGLNPPADPVFPSITHVVTGI